MEQIFVSSVQKELQEDRMLCVISCMSMSCCASSSGVRGHFSENQHYQAENLLCPQASYPTKSNKTDMMHERCYP